MGLPPDNIAYPVRVSIQGSSGSGFYYNMDNATYLVTATHVLFRKGLDLYGKEATLTSLASDLKTKVEFCLHCDVLQANGDLKKHPKCDVAVARMGVVSGEKADGGGEVINLSA